MNLGTLTVTLGIDASALTGASSEVTKSLNNISQRFRTFGYLASATLTAPMVMAGKAAFNMAKDYEFSIQKIVGLTGVAQSAVNDWNDQILKMSPAVAKGPQELADALYFISSSGIKGTEAMNVLELSAKAATSGLGDTKQVADLLTSALNAYRGTGLTASYATDVLVAAVREGKAEASGFSTAMGQIIPIASQLGVSFDQVAGGMAAITLTGSSASNAAVYLKGVFNSLLTASTKGEKALNSVGSSYEQLRNILGQQGLIPLMQKLRTIQLQYGDEILSDVLPNIRALTGYLSIAGKNFQYNTELMKRVTNATGSLGEAFAAVADTIKVRYDKAISKAQVSLISLGKSIAETFLPILESLIKKLGQVTEWFNGLTDAQKRNKLEWVAFIAILGPASLLISVIGYAISGLINVVKMAATAFNFLKVAMLSNPYLAAAAAILAVVGGLKVYANKVKDVARAHDSFNTTLVKVNGTLQKLKDLTPADYGTMSIQELQRAQIAVQQEWVKANALYKQGATNKSGFSWFEKLFGANKNNDVFMQTQIDKITQLKAQYDSLGDTIYDVWQKSLIDNEIKRTEKLIADTKLLKAELASINKWYLDRYDESMKKAGENTQAPYTGFPDMKKFFMRTSTFTAGMPTFEEINESMSRTKVLASELTQTFSNMFMSIGTGWTNMVESIIQSIKRLVTEIMARVLVFAILSIISGGTSGLALGAGKLIKGGLGKFLFKGLGRGMADGGVIPEGYPHDTYPAMLSSGETVLPKSLSGAAYNNQMSGEVVFTIAGTTLVGVLKNQGRKTNSYA